MYVVSFSFQGMSDKSLSTLVGDAPYRFIVLLEDLDAGDVSRDANSTGAPTSTEDSSSSSRNSSEKEIDGNTLSLSELFNSLDGVPGADGW